MHGNVGAMLRDHVLNIARTDPTITDVVALTRCSSFVAQNDSTLEDQADYEEYVRSGRDPTIFFHLSGGAKVLAIAVDYRPEDVANLGNAVLVHYDIKKVRKHLNLIQSH